MEAFSPVGPSWGWLDPARAMLWGWSCLAALAGVAELWNHGAEGHRLNVAPTTSTALGARSPPVLPQSPFPAGGEGAGALAVVCTSSPSELLIQKCTCSKGQLCWARSTRPSRGAASAAAFRAQLSKSPRFVRFCFLEQ